MDALSPCIPGQALLSDTSLATAAAVSCEIISEARQQKKEESILIFAVMLVFCHGLEVHVEGKLIFSHFPP